MGKIIDYKNRSVLIAKGISDDGQSNVSINYDRFDKLTYIIELDSDYIKMDGTIYTPTPIPDGQSIIDAKMVTNQNGSVSGGIRMRVTFQYPVPVTDLIVKNFKFFADGVEMPITGWIDGNQEVIPPISIINSDENWQVQHPDNTVIELNLAIDAYWTPALIDMLGKVYSVQAFVGNGTGEMYRTLFSDDTWLNTEIIEEGEYAYSMWYDTVEDTYYQEPGWWTQYDIYERTATNPPE
jgi:hypothetical protein